MIKDPGFCVFLLQVVALLYRHYRTFGHVSACAAIAKRDNDGNNHQQSGKEERIAVVDLEQRSANERTNNHRRGHQRSQYPKCFTFLERISPAGDIARNSNALHRLARSKKRQ
jgi:hypothetical protein